MQRTRSLRYTLFICMFAVVLAGLFSHSYLLLAAAVVLAIVLGVVADVVENRPTNPFRKYNALHDHHVSVGE
ncbi:MAG: hypothetical protein OWS03_12885 [Alicyclobacillaceae bacterium]|uniref:hypothetical protein n=1 Tax=Alicyclobacillus sp. SP_1 TaxID=2942475 RepID=UPI0021574089|nr:hypothetical protein [Alicyclobacillus sp. SP_1]MCY0897158.1 hypothetical protein [Alicyclobacillaceae bacterium]